MSKLTIMRGLPASGKSTKTNELLEAAGNTVRLNKDLLRTMLHFDKYNHRNERFTQAASEALAKEFLTAGVNVIIDDTNLNPMVLQNWKDVAKDLSEIVNVKVEVVDMTDVSVDECIARDYARDTKVGAHVIVKMALQHLEYMSGEDVIICDLDGTLCDIEHRLHYVNGEEKDWKSFFGAMAQDSIRVDVLNKLLEHEEQGCKIIFVSARPEDYREQTEAWLEKNLNGYTKLYTALIMRESGDKRKDTDVKGDIYRKYLSKLNIIKVFDDRPSVIRMWRELGLDVEDVGNGIEF